MLFVTLAALGKKASGSDHDGDDDNTEYYSLTWLLSGN